MRDYTGAAEIDWKPALKLVSWVYVCVLTLLSKMGLVSR